MPVTLSPSLRARLHGEARAERWGISVERFGEVLEASAARGLGDRPASGRDVEQYLRSLKLEDLALATACADGHEMAWEHFVREVRPVLYRSADALDPSGGARDLADSLYGELFGVRGASGGQNSLFRYFHGRSTLATWLRSVLSQRYVDRVRAGRRTDELPDEDSPAAPVSPPAEVEPERRRWVAMVHAALAAAIAALDPRDRLRLCCYYTENMKLAAIGLLLKEHEATVSRHLTRTRREIRERVERSLLVEHSLPSEAVAECLAAAAEDAGTLDLGVILAGDGSSGRKDGELVRSMEGGGRRVERA